MTIGGIRTGTAARIGARAAALSICAGLSLTQTAQAQDDGGLSATLTFLRGLSYSDVDGTFADMSINFGLTSQTRTQDFALSLGTSVETDLSGDGGTDIVDPSVSLSYAIQSRQTRLSADLSYAQAEADDFVELASGAPGVLVLDEGSRENRGANVGLEFGREARFGGDLTLGFDETQYTNTLSTDLIDSQTRRAGLGLRFEIDPRITATLAYDLSELDRETGRDLTNESLTFGVDLAVTPTLDAQLSIGFDRITIEEAGTTSDVDGVTYDLALTQDRPGGELSFSLGSEISESGRRTTAMVGATLETRRGSLSGGIGVAESDNSKARPILELAYSEELPRGGYSISWNQSFSNTTDGDETLNSRLRLGWQQDLTRNARFSSDLTYQVSDVLGASDDTSRLSLGAGYSHDLTERWALTTRVSHSLVKEDGAADSRENEIFIGLETLRAWRP